MPTPKRPRPSVRGSGKRASSGDPLAPASRRSKLPPKSERPDGSLRIVVATGPAVFREVLSQALGAERGFVIAGRVSSEHEIIAAFEESKPQIIVFDYEALGPNGEGAITRLRRESPATRILVLATRSGPETVERILHAGASGLVGKESDVATLVRAIRSVARGEIWANRRDTAQALEHLAAASGSRVASDGILTAREAEIVDWVGRGLRNKEIAQRLQIHEKTVKSHLNNIFRKLRVDSRIALVLRAAPDAPLKA